MPHVKRTEPGYVVCVENRGYAASLELRKIYRQLPDTAAAERGQVRIIDESGEDYLYPHKYFIAIEVPRPLEAALRRAS